MLLPSGAVGDDINRKSRDELLRYIRTHAASWRDHLQSDEHVEFTFYLITGVSKCKDWTAASYSQNSEGSIVDFGFKPPPVAADLSAGYSCTSTSHPVTVKYWPVEPTQSSKLLVNQTPFLRGFRITVIGETKPIPGHSPSFRSRFRRWGKALSEALKPHPRKGSGNVGDDGNKGKSPNHSLGKRKGERKTAQGMPESKRHDGRERKSRRATDDGPKLQDSRDQSGHRRNANSTKVS